MSLKDELLVLVDRKQNRKDIASRLSVSLSLLSQWTNGKEHITESNLAKLVELVVPKGNQEPELLRLLLLLWKERIERGNNLDKEGKGWTLSSKKMAERAVTLAASFMKSEIPSVKTAGRTLCDFPGSFYPLAIVSGDKREDSESRITAADFGAVSASGAELRWLCELGLKKDVELYGDKIFVLEGAEELKKRFGSKHLLIVGSPGSNHLARRCLLASPIPGWNSTAVPFRFNLPQYTLNKIEEFLKTLAGLRPKQLVGKRAEEGTERNMKNWLHYLFTGGILDPTNINNWVSGHDLPSNRDYGFITIGRNPFCDPGGELYTCIMVAGFHLFGTAHALKKLANPKNEFKSHPLGGVIKVSLNTELSFAQRFDDSSAKWDDEVGYDIDELRKRLKLMRSDLPPTLNITVDGIDDCLRLIDCL